MIWKDTFLYTHQLTVAYSAITVTSLEKRFLVCGEEACLPCGFSGGSAEVISIIENSNKGR